MIFYINENTHEIHRLTCSFVDPDKYPNVVYLGNYNSSEKAVIDALERSYYKANACTHCCSKTNVD
ncbi:MAG: hypothetical protein Q7K48_08205 [Fusobacterium sp. JB021]|nr:hypothetical protein [Fusobacterium sp. JB020]MDP0494267.1 hypothetical protein [Fusobacterium sp. JB021]MDP0505752.1 hypothetical protein [Fusobacterium sp. JB019]